MNRSPPEPLVGLLRHRNIIQLPVIWQVISGQINQIADIRRREMLPVRCNVPPTAMDADLEVNTFDLFGHDTPLQFTHLVVEASAGDRPGADRKSTRLNSSH